MEISFAQILLIEHRYFGEDSRFPEVQKTIEVQTIQFIPGLRRYHRHYESPIQSLVITRAEKK